MSLCNFALSASPPAIPDVSTFLNTRPRIRLRSESRCSRAAMRAVPCRLSVRRSLTTTIRSGSRASASELSMSGQNSRSVGTISPSRNGAPRIALRKAPTHLKHHGPCTRGTPLHRPLVIDDRFVSPLRRTAPSSSNGSRDKGYRHRQESLPSRPYGHSQSRRGITRSHLGLLLILLRALRVQRELIDLLFGRLEQTVLTIIPRPILTRPQVGGVALVTGSKLVNGRAALQCFRGSVGTNPNDQSGESSSVRPCICTLGPRRPKAHQARYGKMCA